ncbi:MAG: non-canonical purine NTP pyrophosphatase [Bryobacteraceae bacterium]
MKLYCASSNPGKLREFKLSADHANPGQWELTPLAGVAPPLETGATFEENAVQKALYYRLHAPGPLLVEDSGLEVDALGGNPGVRSARFAGEGASDRDNNRMLIERLRGVADRRARYVCAIALAIPGQPVVTFRGEVEGVIVDEPRGAFGFGYDPHFFYPPFGCTFGEAAPDRKLAVSHRGRAAAAMLAFLRERYS